MSPSHHRARRWRILLVVVAVIAGVGIAAAARGTPNTPTAPAAPAAMISPPDAESSAWYCTGQSTSTGSAPAPGFLVLTSTVARPVTATITTVTDGGASARTAVSVPARGVATPSLPPLSTGSWEADTVSVDGGGVAVSQVVATSSGWDESPCQSAASSHWYFPGGTTTNAGLFLSLLNPTSTPVVVDLTFVTPTGAVQPINYQGVVLQPGAVLVENVASEVQNESTVSTVVTTRTGHVVASELQTFGATSGLSLVSGVATAQSRWTIPEAEEATDGTSEIDVFNPGTTPEHVTAHLRLASGPLAPLSNTVPAGSTWVLKTSTQTRIPVGAPYSADIDASEGPGVVVGRTVQLPATAPAAQSGLTVAFDGLSQAPSGGNWIVPPPGSASRPALSGVSPESVALTNTSGAAEHYSAVAVSPTGDTTLAAGTITAGTTVLVSGSVLSRVAFDPIEVRASGTMAVTQDLGPSGGVGVVTMPGIPAAAAIDA